MKISRLLSMPAAAMSFALAASASVANAAANSPIAAPIASAAAVSPTGGLWRMLLGLVVVLAVMAAAFWALKQLNRGGLAGSGPMRTVGAISVGPKERVVLIECNGAWVMVGTAPGRVNSLHAMPAPAGGSSAASSSPAAPGIAGAAPNVPPFMRWLDKALQGKGKPS